eukprot:4031951-Pyramimonas_sp.AAC.1
MPQWLGSVMIRDALSCYPVLRLGVLGLNCHSCPRPDSNSKTWLAVYRRFRVCQQPFFADPEPPQQLVKRRSGSGGASGTRSRVPAR